MTRQPSSRQEKTLNGYGRTIRTAGVPLALIATLVLLVWAPAGASAAPQGPWVLPATDLSASGRNAEGPQVAIGPDGTTTAVWHRDNGTDYIIQAATRPAGGTFATPVDLSALGREAYAPQVATGPDGTTTVVWQSHNGTNYIIQAATRPPGGTFSAPVDLSAPGQSAYSAQVATASDGSTTVVWARSNGTYSIVQAATRPPGGAFSTPVDLSATGESAYAPQVATRSGGGITVVWQRYDGTSYVAQATTRPPGGTFSAPVDLSLTGQSASGTRAAIGPDGSTTVVWTRHNGTNFIIQAATRPAGGAFSAPVDLSAAGQDANAPSVATGPDGSTTVVWYRYDGTNWVIQAVTRPAGGTFSIPVDLSLTGGDATDPKLASGSDGTATAVWARNNGPNDIIQAATRPAGGVFSAPVDLSASGQSAADPQLTVGPDGAATSIWYRSDGTNSIVQSASTAPPSLALKVTRSGTGSGRVTSSPTGIECGTSCAGDYLSYTKVTLTATADPGSSFGSWDGACSGTAPTCEVTMLEAKAVDAAFTLNPPPPNCEQATLKLDRFKANRKQGTGTLKVTLGTAGTVALKGSKTVRKSVKKLNRKGTVTLKIKAKGKASKKLKRRGSARLKLKLTFRPKNGCEAKTRTRKLRLTRRP